MSSLKRIVSLVPSMTETIIEWGITPIACTRFCEQPTIQAVGGTKDPDIAAIKALHPDLVILDREENRHEDYLELVSNDIQVHSLHVTSLDTAGNEVGRLAKILGCEWSFMPSSPLPRRNIVAFVPIWRRPWMTVGSGTYGADVLNHLGIDVLFSEAGDRYPTIDDEMLARAEPDFVLAPTEPYPFGERHLAMLEEVAPTVFVDGQDLFWWGARMAKALERLNDHLSATLGRGLR